MNKKTYALLMCLGLSQVTGPVFAEPAGNQPFSVSCWRNNGTIYPNVAGPGERKVVYGPYTAKCGTIAHGFELRTSRGARLEVTVEKLTGGNWTEVVPKKYDPYAQIGSGTFRVILKNTNTLPQPYKGKFSIPL